MRITPVIKGIITSAVMIGIILLIYRAGDKADTRFQYLVYISYALGIIWTVMAYRMSANFTGKFGDTFNQGFRCFVVVVLVVAAFYGVFSYSHPEFVEESAIAYKEQLIEAGKKASDKQMLPDQIDKEVATFKKQYTLKLVSGAIFGYLIIGAGVTAILSALFIRRK